MKLDQYLAASRQRIDPSGLVGPQLSDFVPTIPGIRQPAQDLVPQEPPPVGDGVSFPISMEPSRGPSAMALVQPQTSAQQRLQDFLTGGIRPGYATPQPAPARDPKRERDQAIQSALMGAAFGLGLGGPGAAVSLADYAARGANQGADDAYQEAMQRTNQANEQAQARAQAQRQADLDQLRGLQAGAQLEQGSNEEAWRQAYQQDQLQQREDQARATLDERSRQDRERENAALRDDRQAFLTQLSRLDPASQQALLDQAEKTGELARLGADKLLGRGPDGKWSVMQAAPREFSPMQDPKFVALRDRARRLAEELKNPLINPAYKDQLSQELAQVEAALGVGTGQGLPQDAFLPMSPYQQTQQGLGERRQLETERSNRAREVLQREGIDLRQQGMQFEIAKWIAKPVGGSWEIEGLRDINKIQNEINAFYNKAAQLRKGRTQVNPITGEAIVTPPTQEEKDAADELLNAIDDKMQIQEAIAGRYGYMREPGKREWKRIGGPGVGKSNGKPTKPLTLPPIQTGTPVPGNSLFNLDSYRGERKQ